LPYNGAGVFVRLYSWITDRNNGVKIRADRMDNEMNGFATGLSNCITRDGQTTVTANISLSGNKLTNIGAATAGGDAVSQSAGDARYGQLAVANSWDGSQTFDEQLLGKNGTVSSPAFAFASENGTGLWRKAAGTAAFSVSGSEILRITSTSVESDRNLIVTGTLSVSSTASVGNASAGGHAVNRDTADGRYIRPAVGISGQVILDGTLTTTANPALTFSGDTNTGLTSVAADEMALITGGAARFNLNNTSATFAVPLTAAGLASSNGLSVNAGAIALTPTSNLNITGRTIITGNGVGLDCLRLNRTGDTTPFTFQFLQSGGVTVGSISYNGTSTLYNATSDYRLKDEVSDLIGGVGFIMALRPRRFRMIASGLFTSGFIAHEFAEVSPHSVSGVKDAVEEDGSPVYQAMQASSPEVMAHLVQALQTLITDNEGLKARVAALEAA